MYVSSRLYEFLGALDGSPVQSDSNLNGTQVSAGGETEGKAEEEWRPDFYKSFELRNARAFSRLACNLTQSVREAPTHVVYAGTVQGPMHRGEFRADIREFPEGFQVGESVMVATMEAPDLMEREIDHPPVGDGGGSHLNRKCSTEGNRYMIASLPEPEVANDTRDQVFASW
jgi:hypothetical protein